MWSQLISRIPGSEAGRKFLKDVGLRAYLQHWAHFKLRLFQKIKLRNEHALHPFWFRPGTSDIDVFRQIFPAREYGCFDDLKQPHLIIDCGANVGYSSIYFLSRFPTAFVIAVEPNPKNFEMLEKNLKPYKGRFKALRAAIWSETTELKFTSQPFGDGRDWSYSVEEAAAGAAGAIKSLTIDEIISQSGYDRVSILKIDIEGAEKQIFKIEYDRWLPRVDNLCIELHGEEAELIFERAISSENFIKSHSGELVVCKRPVVSRAS
jgi:FkbM family methyltransferase